MDWIYSLDEFYFQNPDKKPLGEVKIEIEEDNEKCRVPALDKRWATKKDFVRYLPLVRAGGKICTGVDLEQWIYESEQFLEDMQYLLKVKHFRFWSHMVYEKAALGALVSFLQESTPVYLNLNELTNDERVLNLYQEILNCVVRIICRIITNKESEEEWIEKGHLRELIYSNFLVSIPMLFDLITACGESNSKLLKRIIDTLFQIEPKYEGDLKCGIMYFAKALKKVETEAENEGVGTSVDSSKNIGGSNSELLDTPYDDVVLYSLDCAYTLSILLDLHEGSRRICNEVKLGQSISYFYDNTIPYLYKNIYLINENAQSLQWLNLARFEFLKTFRSMAYFHIEVLLNEPEKSLQCSEDFVSLLTESLSDRTFVIDYQQNYPIEADIDILRQACKDLDTFKAEYVEKGYREESEAALAKQVAEMTLDEPSATVDSATELEGATSLDYYDQGASTSSAYDVPSTSQSSTAATSMPAERDIEKEVENIRDVLPDLGDGFIRRLLSRYDNHEEAIAALLEENLPPDLIEADRSEVYIPPDPQDKLFLQTGVQRRNIFDGDQYDPMTQDNPNCIIKRGKGIPGTPMDAAELLDDKSHVRSLKNRYEEYGLVSMDNEYDDEYDDSYDALLESESRGALAKDVRKVFQAEVTDEISEEEESEEEEEEEEEENEEDKDDGRNSGRGKDFCENPEVIRARYEAARAAKFARRGGGGNRPPEQKPRDVVGNQKGQGQAKEVLHNRQKKEANKSSRANHNRKSGATFKRSRGMIPS